MPLLLLVSPSAPLLPCLLQQGVLQMLHIWLLTDTGAAIPDLTESLLQAAWNQGCFCQPNFQPQWLNHQGDHHQLLAWLRQQIEPFGVIVTPLQAAWQESSWQLTLEPVSAAVIAQLPAPHYLAKSELQAALESSSPTLPPVVPLIPLLEQWHRLTVTDMGIAWTERQGQSLRYWWHRLSPWQALAPDARAWLTTTIREHLADPQAPGQRLVLTFFRRQPLPLAEPAKPWDDYFGGSKLQILPPPESLHVTILVTTHNRLPWLKRTIASIQTQTFGQWQLILGDDASTDDTEIYGRALALQDIRIQYYRNASHQGFQATLTALYQAATTELVIHCSDDDWWEPFHLQQMMDFFQAHPWVGLVASACYLAEMHTGLVKDKLSLPLAEANLLEPLPALQQLPVQAFAGPGCLYRKRVLQELAATDPQAHNLDDPTHPWPYAIWDSHILARCLTRYEVGYIPRPSVYLSLSEHSRTEHNVGQSVREEIEWVKQWLADYQAFRGTPGPANILNLLQQKLAERMAKLAQQQVIQPQPLEPWLQQQRELWTTLAQVQEGLNPQ